MKLHLADLSSQNAFTGYGEGYVAVNGRHFRASLLVLPDSLHPDWPVAGFDALRAEHFELVASLRPEIVLLGTGPTFRFPPAAATRPLAAARIGIEVMDTRAACRTYNILMAEGRRVAAALVLT